LTVNRTTALPDWEACFATDAVVNGGLIAAPASAAPPERTVRRVIDVMDCLGDADLRSSS
jgi:hypothetical protein